MDPPHTLTLIVAFSGTATEDSPTLSALIRTAPVGNVAHLDGRRPGTTITIDATLSTQAA